MSLWFNKTCTRLSRARCFGSSDGLTVASGPDLNGVRLALISIKYNLVAQIVHRFLQLWHTRGPPDRSNAAATNSCSESAPPPESNNSIGSYGRPDELRLVDLQSHAP